MENITKDEQNTLDADKMSASQPEKEEIKFQRIMNYKAYRRGMILFRLSVATALAIGLAVTGMLSLFIGIALPVIVYIFAAISILYSIGNEQTYTVYNTRVVLKRRGDYGRKSVPFDSIVSVEYKSAFYEKRLRVGTITVKAKADNGKVKKYKMKHISDAKPVAEFLSENIHGRKTDGGQD